MKKKGGGGEKREDQAFRAFNKYLGVPRETFPELFMNLTKNKDGSHGSKSKVVREV